MSVLGAAFLNYRAKMLFKPGLTINIYRISLLPVITPIDYLARRLLAIRIVLQIIYLARQSRNWKMVVRYPRSVLQQAENYIIITIRQFVIKIAGAPVSTM